MPGTSLCLEFEQDLAASGQMNMAYDGSGAGRDAVATDVVSARRVVSPAVVDDEAAGFGLTSSLVIDADLAIDGDVTVEMWIQIVPGADRFMIDSNGRFYMAFDNADKQIRCGINRADPALKVDSDQTIEDGAWHHVACTFDRQSTIITVYLDGSASDCSRLYRTIAPNPGGTTIGAPHGQAAGHMVGAIDSVRVYDRVLPGAEICALAGGPSGCTTSCTPSTGGSGSSGSE